MLFPEDVGEAESRRPMWVWRDEDLAALRAERLTPALRGDMVPPSPRMSGTGEPARGVSLLSTASSSAGSRFSAKGGASAAPADSAPIASVVSSVQADRAVPSSAPGKAASASAASVPSAPPATPETKILEVVSGDTFKALVGGKEVTVRIAGVDAPRWWWFGGKRAKENLESLLRRAPIEVYPVGVADGKMIADVMVGDVDASRWMAMRGDTPWGPAPQGWPNPREFRRIWNSLGADDRRKWMGVLAGRQKIALSRVNGAQDKDEENRWSFEAGRFLREVVTPQKEKNEEKKELRLVRRPDRSEVRAWFFSLHPKERDWFLTARDAEKTYLESIGKLKDEERKKANSEKRSLFAGRSYNEFKADLNAFIDATTRRFRQYRPNREVIEIVKDVFRREGMSDNGIAGVLHNIRDESNFNPALRVPDQPNWRGEARYAHGLFQEGGAEWLKFHRWLAGRDWRDASLQSEFVAKNIKQNYPHVWNAMRTAKTPEDAAIAFLAGYLRPLAQHMRRRAYRIRKYGVGKW